MTRSGRHKEQGHRNHLLISTPIMVTLPMLFGVVAFLNKDVDVNKLYKAFPTAKAHRERIGQKRYI